jgi:putative thioredoxin
VSNVPPMGAGANLRGAIDLSPLVNQPRGEAGRDATPSSVVVPATDANFGAVVDLSRQVPVLVEFYAPGLEPALPAIVESYGGRLVLATVDGQANPQLAQVFQVVEVPAVAAVIAGRPLPLLYVGAQPEEQVRRLLDQVLQVAAQQGVTGSVPVDGAAEATGEPEEEPLPPHHQAAYDAIAAGDLDTAAQEYRTAIAQDPRDQLAVAGLAQVALLQRLQGADADAVRSAAAQGPQDLDAQLAVADLDLSGGHLDDAFGRLLDLFPSLDAGARDAVRHRLLDYFEIAGPDDPRVGAARRRLAALLY